MVDNPQKVEVEVEANAIQAVRGAQAVGKEWTHTVQTLAQAEKLIRELLTGSERLSKDMKGFAKNLQTVQTLPTDARALRNTTRALSSGGSTTAVQNAAVQGVVNTYRADPAMQLLKLERERNNVLAAREKIYRDLRAAMPDDASAATLRDAYRDALKSIGDMPGKADGERSAWNKRTLAETKQFQANVTRAVEAEAEKRAAAELRTHERNQARIETATKRRLERERVAQEKEAARNTPQARQQKTVDRLSGRANFIGDYALIGAGMGAATFSVTSSIQMQNALRQLQAISQATDVEMASLEKTIYAVGQQTRYSTKEIAEASTVMAQAGFSAQQIGAALPEVSKLATGAGASLTDAVNIVTSVLSVYDLSIDRSAKISNELAQALNGSKLSLEQLSLGIQYAGNIAADGGVQFEELTAAMGAMSNAGVKSGSTLGTGLRSLIEELEQPSQKFQEQLLKVGLTTDDVDIKTQGLYGSLLNLKNAGFSSSEAMATFQIRAASAYSALSNNLNVFRDLEDSLYGSTAASDAAAVQMDSLSAQGIRAANAFTQLSSVLGAPFMAALQAGAGAMADLMTAAVGAAPALQVVTTALATFVTLRTAVYLAGIAAGFLGVGVSATGAAVGVRAFTTALLANPLTWWTAGITLAITALTGLQGAQARANAEVEQYRAAANDARAKQQQYGQQAEEVSKYIDMLVTRHASLSTNTTLAAREAEKAVGKFSDYGLALDNTGIHVDGLIGKLVQLRGQLVASALEQAKIERSKIEGENKELAKTSATSATPAARLIAQGALKDDASSLRRVGAYDLMSKFSKGTISPDESLQLQSILRSNKGLIRETSPWSSRQTTILDGLSNPNAAKIAQNNRALGRLNEQISGSTVGSSSQALQLGTTAAKLAGQYRDEDHRISGIKDPVERNKARRDLEARKKSDYDRLIGDPLKSNSNQLLQDPQVASGMSSVAKAYGISPQEAVIQQLLSGDRNLAELTSGARGTVVSNDPKLLRAQKSRLQAEYAEAKKAKDTNRMREKSEQIKAVDERLFAVTGEDNPTLADALGDEAGQAQDSRLRRDLMGGGGSGDKTARISAKTAASKAKALERQIEVGMINGANETELQKLLDLWKSAKEDNIRLDGRATGASADDVKQRLEDFQEQAKEYTHKVIDGTVQEAKDQLAKQADQAANDKASISAARLQSTGGDLGSAISDTQGAFADALAKAIDAANYETIAKGGDPNIAPGAIEKRRQLTRDFATKTIQASLDLIDSWMKGEEARQTQEIQSQQLAIDRRRARVGALSNSWGNRNISDVQRHLGSIESEQLDIDTQRLDVKDLQGRYDRAIVNRDALQAQYSSASPGTEGDLGKRLADANVNVSELAKNLESSKLSLEQMTAQAPTFASFSDAIRGSWQAYSDQAKLTQPMFEQIADGLTGVFQQSQSALGTFFSDVWSGTTSMKQAFKDLAKSILKSMLDMLAKLAAQKLFTWLVGMIVPTASSNGVAAGGSDISTGIYQNAALGGEVRARNYAGGGYVTGGIPNRDSVLGNLMPGEVVMSNAAVSMYGRDQLLEMNAMGNRRLSETPTVQQAAKREPDNVNVYVVSPEKKPQLGKKDILAVVQEDMLTGGDTKKLIKAIQVGAA